MEPGRSRPDGTGDTAIVGASSATNRAWRRVARALRAHTPSSLDSSDTRPATRDSGRPGTPERSGSTAVSCDLDGELLDFCSQSIVRSFERVRFRAHQHVAGRLLRQHMEPHQLAQSPSELVPANNGESELRYHDGDTYVSEWIVQSLDVEQLGANPPAGAQQSLDVGGARYTASAGKTVRPLRRRRTCWEAGPSDACDPSSDDGPKWLAPTSFPCAHGIHAS